MKPIKLFDIERENELIKNQYFESFSNLYDQGDFTLGFNDGPVEELEQLLREHTGRKFALGVSSGTFALEAASCALDIGPGDEVIVPANTFIATATAPANTGAKIVCADINYDNMNITHDTVKKVITKNTKAIYAVNMYGNPVDYDELNTFGLPVVEDAAHSLGSIIGNKPSGLFGDLSCFSFFPTKVYGGIGDSGMVLFDNDEWFDLLKAYRNCGQSKSHYAIVPSSVGRMHTIQALFLIHKWEIFNSLIIHRRKIAAIYDRYFERSNAIKTQRIKKDHSSSYFAYVIKVKKYRDRLIGFLKTRSIDAGVHYLPNHQQPFFRKFRIALPVTERLAKEIITLPLYYEMSKRDVTKVINAVSVYFK